MSNTIAAVVGLVLLFLVYGVLTLGRKHRGCTRCLDDESAERCDDCPLSRRDGPRGGSRKAADRVVEWPARPTLGRTMKN